MFDKRKLKRRHPIYYLKVFDHGTGEHIGHLVDITPEGLLLVSPNPRTIQEVIDMRVELPTVIGGKEELIVKGCCVWCRRDVNPDLYGAGYHFEEIQSDDARIIERLIARFGFND